jgi:uncharacterized protein YfaS (alpha-2-macroglobulin family)
LAAEVGSEVAADRALLRHVSDRANSERWTSTQEKVWMLMATAASLDDASQDLTLNGKPIAHPVVSLDDSAAFRGEVLRLANAGAAKDAILTVYGVPSQPQPAGGNGYRIERTYFTMDGAQVSPDSVTRNTRLAVVLTVTSDREENGRLMINDPLPAGFEIDNPNLLKSGAVSALDWIGTVEDVQMAEFRNDRFLTALDRGGKGQFRLAYIVRAVSPGDFHHPAALVEDMYRPEFRAWTDTGRIQVIAEAR